MVIKAVCIGRISYEINLVDNEPDKEGVEKEFFDKVACGGGSAGNFAYCLAKWGISTAIAGVVGNDNYGNRIKKEFEKVHIDLRYIEQTFENDTNMSVILINQTLKTSNVYNIADKYVSLKRCDFDFNPDLILMDGYDIVQNKNLIQRYPKSITILDASIITNSVLDILKKVKYGICSLAFAEAATGLKYDPSNNKTLVQIYLELKKKAPKTEIVITLGEQGALYFINNQIKITPTIKVEVIDSHGCGQAFKSAFAYAIANGYDIEKAVKYGVIAGSLTATKIGARLAFPTIEEIQNLYEQNYQ